MSKLFYISEDYVPKGQIEGYPLEVVDRMIHEQVKQGNEPDVEVFEKSKKAGYFHGGFYWSETKESRVWEDICFNKHFKSFYEKYGKEHITQEEFNEVNRVTYLKDIKNTFIRASGESNRQSRLEVNRSVLKNFKPLKVEMELLDGVWFDDRVSGKGLTAKEAVKKSEEMKREAEKSLKKAEKKQKEVDQRSKDYIKEAFGNIPEEAKERVEKYDFINPDHYKSGSKEVWEMMVDIWGVEKFIAHCEMCAFKYRMRLGKKPYQPIERDLKKAKWYEGKARELKTNHE